jgi:hypothetical protein
VVQQVQRVALPVHLHGHGIDEERHVVVHDLDHRVGARPAVLLDARVVDADLGRARVEPPRERELRQRRPVQVFRVAVREILGIDLVVVLADEGPCFLGGGGLETLVCEAQDLLQESLLLLVAGEVHGGL